MAIRIVRLGSTRYGDEGLRIGSVRRPPRGVPRAEFSSRDFYDVWLPLLSPSPTLQHAWKNAADEASLPTFQKKFRAEMKQPDAGKTLDLLAALSHQTNFSLGCYCENEALCHRAVLRQLLMERGAALR